MFKKITFLAVLGSLAACTSIEQSYENYAKSPRESLDDASSRIADYTSIDPSTDKNKQRNPLLTEQLFNDASYEDDSYPDLADMPERPNFKENGDKLDSYEASLEGDKADFNRPKLTQERRKVVDANNPAYIKKLRKAFAQDKKDAANLKRQRKPKLGGLGPRPKK